MNNGRTRGRHGTLVGRVQLRVSITCLGGHCASDLPACAASYEAEPTHAPRVRYKSRAEKDEVRISPRHSLRSCSRSLVCPSLSLYPPNRSLDTHHSLPEKMFRATVATVLAFSTLASAFSGDGTFYAAGLGACGITNSDTDMIAAISSTYFDAYPYVVFLVFLVQSMLTPPSAARLATPTRTLFAASRSVRLVSPVSILNIDSFF